MSIVQKERKGVKGRVDLSKIWRYQEIGFRALVEEGRERFPQIFCIHLTVCWVYFVACFDHLASIWTMYVLIIPPKVTILE